MFKKLGHEKLTQEIEIKLARETSYGKVTVTYVSVHVRVTSAAFPL